MKKMPGHVSSIICGLLLLSATTPLHASNFDAWGKKAEITFSGYTGAETLSNFPALVVLGTNSIAGFDYAQLESEGSDLRFSDSTGTVELPYEIDTWNPAGDSLVWVRVPELVDADTSIWVYWNKAGQTAPDYSAVGGVWPASYRGVWHLGEDAVNGQTSMIHEDSTTNCLGATQCQNNVDAGVIGNGQFLDGANDWIAVTNHPALDMGPIFTWSGWLRFNGSSVGWNRPISRKSAWNGNSGWELQLHDGMDKQIDAHGSDDSQPYANDLVPSWTSKNWYYVTAIFSNTTFRAFSDGVEKTVSGTVGAVVDNDNQLVFGNNPAFNEIKWNGWIDEFRIRTGVPSADWIKAEYQNMASNAAFQTYGTAQTVTTEIPSILAGSATNIMATSAWLCGNLVSTGASDTAVIAYWGTTDGGTNAANWANSTTLAAPQHEGAFSIQASGLAANATYYYCFAASNEAGIDWTPTSFFINGEVSMAKTSDADEVTLSAGVFTVSRPGTTTNEALVVDYAQTGGTAVSGVDFVALSGSVTIPAGAASATIEVTPLKNHAVQEDTTLELTLIGAAAILGASSNATMTIANQAMLAEVYISQNGDNSDGKTWATALTSIQAGLDLVSANGTIRVAGGQTFETAAALSWAPFNGVTLRGGYDPATGLPGAAATVITRSGAATAGLLVVTGVSGGELRDVTLSGGVLYPAADHAYGAGVRISDSTGYALVDCTISGNKAQSVNNKNARGGGVALVDGSTASLTGCSIFDNEAENVGRGGNEACGAGLYVAAGCTAAVTNGVVARNRVIYGTNQRRGAGVYTEGAVSLFNCLVYNNVILDGAWNSPCGDGLCANGSASITLNFCTIAYNGTCGLYRDGGTVSASDSILWGNGDDVYGTVTLTRCNVADGDSNGDNGNISAEPKFVFGFRLDAASPCLDQSALTASEAGLASRTTLASGATDSGFADLGWHAPAAAVDASAANLHVAATGDDATGDGSSGAPFASVTKALTLAAPGTTIHVGEGTFNAASGEVFPWVFDKALDVAIAGAGAELTVFDAGGADASIARMTNSTCIAFSGATFTGTAYGPVLAWVPAYGGAIGGFASCGTVIDSCTIRDNELRPNANSSNAFGGGAGFYASGEALVTNCVIKGNVANARHTNATYAYGGGLYFAKTEGRLVGCRVQGNRIQFAQNARRGGGVCNEGDSNVAVELVNCLIVGNTAYTSRGVGEGDGLWGRFTIRHSTVAANPGGGKGVKFNSAVTAFDSIFYANGGDFGGTPTLTYCNTEDGLQVGANGNISVDPLFDRGYYLATGSLCIDAGSQNAADSSIAGRTTSTDGTADAAVLDMGYHYATGSQAAEYFVSTEGSDDNPGTEALPFRSVTKALSVISDADRIHIGAGRYTAATETFPLLVNGLDAIELLGTGEVVLDGGMANNQVLIIRNSTQVKLSGLTLTGGYPLNNPSTSECLSGGLYAEMVGGLRLTDCVISNNYTKLNAGYGYGGGICIKTGSAEFIRCLIADNEIHTTQNNGFAFGGGAYLDAKATVVMRDCVVLKNRIVQTQYWKGCGLAAADTCTVVLDNCLVNGNKGEGMYVGQGVGLWGKRFFLNNTTVAYNYGSGWDCNGGTACAATNSLFWGNGDDIVGMPTLTHCNVEDGDGAGVNGTISADPQFDRTLYLAATSPCRDNGLGTAAELGLSTKTTSVDGSPDTGTVDMGYHYAAGLAAPAPADIFVAASGDDATGTGGAGAPFRSITRALAFAGSGTRINVGAGVYNAASGEAFPLTMRDAMHVAIVGAGADATVLNAEGANANVFSFFDVGGLEVRGVTITGANPRSTTSGLDGGGVQILDCSKVEIVDCMIASNAVNSTFSSVYGGGISLRRAIGAVRNCRITDNATTNTSNNGTSYGMGISVGKTSDVLIDRCTVTGNNDYRTRYPRGGGVYKHPFAKLTVRNSLIADNEPLPPSGGSGEGGGIHCADPPYGGEKIFIQSCTIADNARHGIFGGAKYTTLTNTIVWGNTIALSGATEASAGNCDIQDGQFAGSGGNISSDPLFRNSAIGNYILATTSPCLDAGVEQDWMADAFDLAGGKRFVNLAPDIGCYEIQSPAPTVLLVY